ncbi:MAG: hypothetical protein A2W91_15430 [Bacteroidetes bacterium GWF2_38_335]|nr:MAG: hypothetical protein A2W91_15430 [Bacteroidetes bacterium GWF2_38_335]OFY81488.1 MAG: hypothetical protein A2281_11290 [Bacteroidetes bacterium RIFOXYA12_FULL_38_20]HBS87654.1 hypothetical protein [Bacteroidales bacterium]
MNCKNTLIWPIVTLVAMFILSCESKTGDNDKKDETDTVKTKKDTLVSEQNPQSKAIEYELIANDFIKVFNEKNTADLNKFLHPAYGVFILNNPGAFVAVSHYESFGKAFADDWGPALKERKINGTINTGDLPNFDCETNSWDAEGLIITENPPVKLLDFFKAGVEYEVIQKDEKLQKLIQDVEPQIVFSLYDTKSTIGLFFAKIDDKWYLIYIDRVDPCSA